MDNLYQSSLLMLLLAIAGLWWKLSRGREMAAAEVHRQCARHGLQWLDETVILQSLRLRRAGGRYCLECCYRFGFSLDGNDRRSGQLWLTGGRCVGLSLPGVACQPVR